MTTKISLDQFLQLCEEYSAEFDELNFAKDYAMSANLEYQEDQLYIEQNGLSTEDFYMVK